MPPPDSETSRWFAQEVHPHEGALRSYLRTRFPTITDGEVRLAPNQPHVPTGRIVSHLDRGYLSDNVSKGYEFDVIANPTRNWTLRFCFSHSERKRTNVLTEGEPWWAQQRELFTQLDTLYRQRTGQPSVINRPFIAPNRTEGNLTVEGRIADSTVQLDNIRGAAGFLTGRAPMSQLRRFTSNCVFVA